MRAPFLVPRLRESLVATGRPWRSLDVHDEIDSTNAECLRLGEPWRVVLAEHQQAGRGRMRRAWEAPAHTSVLLSVLLPGKDAPWGWLPLLAGLAMTRAVWRVAHLELGLKWPNDVLAPADGERKVCGILCEVGNAGVVVGAGLNVDQTRAELPVPTGSSLALCGARGAAREGLVVAFLDELAAVHTGWGTPQGRPDQEDYRRRCLTIGRVVTVHTPGGAVSGRVSAVDEDGRLLVDGGQGPASYAAGDVEHMSAG
ncbi:MAG TPA: biotin--[acetyl-CoA-carboxylase] ligase [Candidatus Lustribacter sp.]|nr:biotin--[acetyl-CoA-carboxylase] ligase [Candidatus Lustribacter sp.]